MPAMYLAIKHRLTRKGVSESKAETIAAKTYNARRPAGTPPVTRHYEEQIKHEQKSEKRRDRGNSSSEY